MRRGLVSITLFLGLTLLGCMPNDEEQPLIPFKGVIGTTTNSIYTHQSYFSLADSSELRHNRIEDWDLGFEASANGEHVILNNADLLFVANLGPVDFNQATGLPSLVNWTYDASSGHFDSLAIKDWVNTSQSPFVYAHNVYFLGREGDDGIKPLRKFTLIELTPSFYRIVVDNLDNSLRDTFTVNKDPLVNFVKISLRNRPEVRDIEPSKQNWDLQFTQYQDSIPDDDGKLYSYVLRGVFINPSKVKVACYYISTSEVPEYEGNSTKVEDELKQYFENPAFNSVNDSLYHSNWDVIGWEWKDVTIDEAANTAVYKADTRRIYFFKDLNDGTTYKLRFFGYYTNGESGYPWFQYIRVS